MLVALRSFFYKKKKERIPRRKRDIALMIVFSLFYAILLSVSLLFGNIYFNLLTIAISSIVIIANIKLLLGILFIKMKNIEGKEYKASKGNMVSIRLSAINKSLFTYPVCYISLVTPKGIEIPEGHSDKISFGMTSFSKQTYYYSLVCPYRGKYEVGADKLYIQNDIGTRTVSLSFDGMISLVVYPKIYPLRDFDSIKLQEIEDIGFFSFLTKENSDSLVIRDYQLQDSMRQIHWKASSKLDKYMSKDYFASFTDKLTILFDNSLSYFEKDTLDDLIIGDKLSELTGSVCNFFRALRLRYEFLYFQDDKIASLFAENERDFDSIYYLLASLDFKRKYEETRLSLRDYFLLQESASSTIYIFTSNIDRNLVYSLRELGRMGLKFGIIYVKNKNNEKSFIEEARLLSYKFSELDIEDDSKQVLEAF